MLKTSYENDGYDGKRGSLKWWFEAWGSGSKAEWTNRADAGRPPRPEELARADFIVFGFRKRASKNYPDGRVFYRTRSQGLDFRKAPRTRKRK